MALTPDETALYFTGLFVGSVDFDPSVAGVQPLTATATNSSTIGQDAYVLKLNASNGGYMWAVATSGQPGNFVSNPIGNGIKVGASGNVYAIGQFTGTFDFDPTASVTSITSVSGASGLSKDAYVWKLSSAGALIWVKVIGGTSSETADAIGLDTDENVYITGSFSGTVDFDPSPLTSFMLATSDITNNDPYALKLTSAGNFVAAAKFGASTGTADYGVGIAPGSTTQVAITGVVQTTVAVDFGGISLTPAGDRDIFITSYDFPNPCQPLEITQQPASASTVCQGRAVSVAVSVTGSVASYQWYKGTTPVASQTTATLSLTSTTISDNGSYSLVITGSGTCGSLTTSAFNLTVNANPTPGLNSAGSATVTCVNPVTLVASGGSSYTFSGPSTLAQNTSGTITVSGAGTYSVAVSNDAGCVASTTIAVSQDISLPSVSLAASNGGVLTCNNPSVTLTASSTSSVTFTFGGPGLQSQYPSTGIATVNLAGTYSVTAQRSGGCASSTTVAVSGTSSPLPAPNVVVSGCSSNFTITASSPGATLYTAIGPNSYSQSNGSGVFAISASGSYTITASNGSAGCDATTIKEVVPGVLASASSFSATGPVSCGNPVKLVAVGIGTAFVFTGPGGYVFSNVYRSSGTYNAFGLNVQIPGTYTLTVYNGEGCPPAVYTTQVSGTTCP